MAKDKLKKDAEKVANTLLNCEGMIYTFGNGGSASIADHMACDWMKGTNGHVRVISLSSNGPLLSAIANDTRYHRTCSDQLAWLTSYYDNIVLISSSGRSPNILVAAQQIKDMALGPVVIGFSGNAGTADCKNHLKDLCDVSVYCDSKDYGTIEDYHSNVMHETLRIMKRKLGL